MPQLAQARLDDVNKKAFKLFPTDPYMRICYYTREATMDSRCQQHYSPRIITSFVVGHGGYGKTTKMRQMARDLGIGYREVKLGGITDIAEVIGMVDTVDVMMPDGSTKKKTVLCPPNWWPDPESNPDDAEGIIVFDDATRCLPHIMNAVMQLWIDGEYNGLVLPDGWNIICTGNPEGEYNVTSMDSAQWSRMLVIGYTRPNELFYEQLERQDIHDDLKNVWMSTEEDTVSPPQLTLELPTNNDRLKMIFGRVYPYLLGDDQALTIAAKSMFGPKFLTILASMREKDRPISPDDILNNWEEVAPTLKRYIESRRTDLVNISTVRLLTYMTSKNPDEFTEDQYANVARLGEALPSSEQTLLVTRLTGDNGGKGQEFGKLLKLACMKTDSTFAKTVRETIVSIERRLAGVG